MLSLILSLVILLLPLYCRRKGIASFCLFTVIYNYTSSFIPDSQGLAYYLSAGINDYFIILWLATYTPYTKLIMRLQLISLIFIPTHLLGWVIYEGYYSPIVYDSIADLLYIYAIYTILKHGDFKYVGFIELANRGIGFCHTHYTSLSKLFRDKKENFK